MSPTFSPVARVTDGTQSSNDNGEHSGPQLVPSWHGAYLARRGRQRSDPRLIRYLVGMAIVAIVGVAIFLSSLLLQDLKKTDLLRADATNLQAVMAMEEILGETTTTLETVASILENYPTDADPSASEIRRQHRREISLMIDESPVAGLVLVDSLGEVRFETGRIERANIARWAKMPLESGAQLLGNQVSFLSSDTDQGALALFLMPGQERALIALLDQSLLSDALTPESEALIGIYLQDEAGRILATSYSGDSVADLKTVPRSRNLFERNHRNQLDASKPSFNSASSQVIDRALSVSGLHVLVIAPPITIDRFFAAKGLLLVAGWGLAVLVVGALVYVIQTEWKKHDRRIRLDEDVLARSEIAADIMGAGIIDWRVSDASVSYSEGWQRLFSDDAPIADEEIFDWIDRLHPEYQESTRENYQALIDGRIFEVNHAIKVRKRDGSYVTVVERGRTRINENGKVTRVVLVQRPMRET